MAAGLKKIGQNTEYLDSRNASLDLLEHAAVLRDTHAQKLVASPVLVQEVVCVFTEFLHVGSDQHLPELDKVAVILIVDLDNTPGVSTATDGSAVWGLDFVVGANNGKGYLAGNLLILGKSFLIFIFVSRSLENLDVVVGNVG